MKNFLGRGLSFPLQVGGYGRLETSHAEQSIAQSIRLILGTAPGERVMRPEFGCQIHDLVFHPGVTVPLAQLLGTRRCTVDLQEKGGEVDAVPRTQRASILGRHGDANRLDEIPHGTPAPGADEVRPGKLRSLVGAPKVRQMAFGAPSVVKGAPSGRLFFRIDGLLRQQRVRQRQNRQRHQDDWKRGSQSSCAPGQGGREECPPSSCMLIRNRAAILPLSGSQSDMIPPAKRMVSPLPTFTTRKERHA